MRSAMQRNEVAELLNISSNNKLLLVGSWPIGLSVDAVCDCTCALDIGALSMMAAREELFDRVLIGDDVLQEMVVISAIALCVPHGLVAYVGNKPNVFSEMLQKNFQTAHVWEAKLKNGSTAIMTDAYGDPDWMVW